MTTSGEQSPITRLLAAYSTNHEKRTHPMTTPIRYTNRHGIEAMQIPDIAAQNGHRPATELICLNCTAIRKAHP